MQLKSIFAALFTVLGVCKPLPALDSSQVLLYIPFDGNFRAAVAKGRAEAIHSNSPEFVEGIRGQAVKLGKSTWGNTQEWPAVRMPVDVGLWRPYGHRESLGPLGYPALGNINDREGTLSLWFKPLGWDLANSRDHFVVNLGMKDTLALAYFTYFGCFSFQNSVGENVYKRCIAYLPGEWGAPNLTRDRWAHITLAWRDDFMKTWLNGKPLAVEREQVIPLRNPSGEIRLGSGDDQEAAMDDLVILAQAVGDAEAKALYNRNAAARDLNFLAVPPMNPPVLDGKLTSAEEWQNSTSLTGWVDSILGVANRDTTRIKVGHDMANLYVALVWPVPEKYRSERTKYVGSPVKVTVRERDADLSQGDFVAVLLSPPGSNDVYSFATNAGGALRDEKNGDATWNGHWQAHQTWDDHSWVVEFAIPLARLGPVSAEAEWGLNFAHSAKQVDLMDSVWTYQPATIRPLARARLIPQQVFCEVASLGDLNEGQFSLKASVFNREQEPFAGESETAVREDDKALYGPEKKAWSLPAGGREDLAAEFALSQPAYAKASFSLKDRQGNPLLVYHLPFVFSRELRLETNYVPTPQLLQVVIDFGSTSTLAKATGGTIKIQAQGQRKALLTQSLPRFTKVRTIVNVNCQALAVGKYDLMAELKLGPSSSILQDTFEKPAPPEWLGNRIGYSDKVPVPWSPLKVTGNKISCWGRTYSLGTAGLPAQINVLGQDILASPARLLLTSKGKSQPLPPGTLHVTHATEARVASRSSSRLQGVKVESHQWLEFDGFAWNTLTVSAARPTRVEGLAIEIPLKPEHATLWRPAEYVPSGPGGDSPQEPYTSAPINGMRLGDEERGLQFSFETTGRWIVDAGKEQQLLPGEKEYVVRFNLIAKPTTLTKPMAFSLGWQALPSRPRSPYFRRIDMDANWSGLEQPDKASLERTGKLFSIHPIYTEGWSRHWNHLNFWNPEVFEEDFIGRVKQGVQANWEQSLNTLSMYLNVTTTDANTPEYRTYRREWRPAPGDAPYMPPDPATRDKVAVASLCVGAKSYTDFYMACLERTVKRLSDNGKIPVHVYLDNSGMISCANELHGCPKEGRLNLLAHREYMKRLYNILKSVNPLNQVLVHCSGDNRMSSWSFADAPSKGSR